MDMRLGQRPLFVRNSFMGMERDLFVPGNLSVLRKPKDFNIGRIEVSRGGLIIRGVAVLESTQAAKSNEDRVGYSNLRMGNDSSCSTCTVASSSEESAELDDKERLRRMRISKSNKGNTPWNKGKKHSPETVQRIKERTRLAMQDPKVKMKLVNMGHAQSEETRIKIGLGVRMGWEKRREKWLLQETCYLEWQNLIAEGSRKGLLGEEELQWDSYKIMAEQLEIEWLQSVEQRKKLARPKGSKRGPKSPEQRRKISEAIAAKWADPGYRTRVTSALYKYHGIPEGAERKQRRKPNGIGETRKRAPSKMKVNDADDLAKRETKTQVQRAKLKRSKVPKFKDPSASSKLEMLKSIRAQRAAAENQKGVAITRARALITEAEKAVKALEAAAEKSPVAHASLVEARKLIAEANQSIESIGRAELLSHENDSSSNRSSHENDSGSNRTSSELVTHLKEEAHAETEGLNHSGHKNVNGTQISSTNINSIHGLEFMKSTLHTMLNGNNYKVLPESSTDRVRPDGRENLSVISLTDYDPSPEEANNMVKHSSFMGHFHDPEPNVNEQITHNVLPTGPEPQSGEEQHSKSINVTKKWVRGRLVEVAEEGEIN